MLSWLKRRRRTEPTELAISPASDAADATAAQGVGMSKTFLALFDHLRNRYADTVVLTFAEVEAVLGKPLPASARQDVGWWNGEHDENFEHSNSWRLAKRSAVANLLAQKVIFDRI